MSFSPIVMQWLEINMWGVEAQSLEDRTDDRGVLGSNPGRAASELWQISTQLCRIFRIKQCNPSVPSIWCLCQGIIRSHTGSKCVTCHGLRNSENNPLLC